MCDGVTGSARVGEAVPCREREFRLDRPVTLVGDFGGD